MKPTIWIFAVTYFSWVASEVFLSASRRSKQPDQQNTDKGTLRLIWIIILVANAVAYYVSTVLRAPISEDQNIRYAGLAVIVIGVILRFSIVASLGKFFTVNVTIVEGHKLKTDGLYKYLRHPSYSAVLLSFAGYGISLNNWLSFLIVMVPVSTVFLIRIRIEEKALTDHFGTEYLDYMKRTKKLVPFIY